MSFAATILLDGLSYGMVLFLISVGLTVTMGLMGVLNLAHGAFAMIGGFVAAYLTQNGVNFYLALAAATAASGLLGGLAEISLYRPLYRKGHLGQVMLTMGIAFISIALVTKVFGAYPFAVVFPKHLEVPVDIGFRMYSPYRLFLIVTGLAVALSFWYLVERSLFGAKIRAAVDNPRMARAVGINVGVLFTATFVAGSALAGLGGAVGAGILAIEPAYAMKYLVLFLIVVIVGGEGSFKGSFAAAMAIGIIDTLGKYFLPVAAPYMLYLTAFALLLWRPQGVIPAKAVAK